jgi:hypothetical protein
MMWMRARAGHTAPNDDKIVESVKLTADNLIEALTGLFDRFDGAFAAAPYQQDYHAAGIDIHWRSDHDVYRSMLDRALNTSASNSVGHMQILVACFGAYGLPQLAWKDSSVTALGLDSLLKNTRFRLHIDSEHSLYLAYDLHTQRALQLAPGAHDFPRWEYGGPLRVFINWHLSQLQRALLHAGTLGVNGVGILLAGAGGTGKSSTVVSGICHGLESVGDDYVSVELGQRVIARPVFSIVKLNPERLALLGIDSPQPVNWQGKIELEFRQLPQPLAQPQLEIRALCLPVITYSKTTRVRTITAKEAFIGLAPSAIFQLPGSRQQLFGASANVAKRLPCYRIELGSEAEEIAATIKAFIVETLL